MEEIILWFIQVSNFWCLHNIYFPMANSASLLRVSCIYPKEKPLKYQPIHMKLHYGELENWYIWSNLAYSNLQQFSITQKVIFLSCVSWDTLSRDAGNRIFWMHIRWHTTELPPRYTLNNYSNFFTRVNYFKNKPGCSVGYLVQVSLI